MITFECGECGHRLLVKDELSGRKAKCPKCAHISRIVAAPVAASEGTMQKDSLELSLPDLSEMNNNSPATPPPLDRMPDVSPLPTNRQPNSGEGYKLASTSGKDCPFCGEQILMSAKKCKHCGEFLNEPNRSMDSVPTSNFVQQLGDGRFAFNGDYDWGFEVAQQAMSECKVKIKEADPARGVIKGKCSYGINPFGITVTAAFHASGNQSILEMSANLTDSFDTFGACKKKVRQISERVIELGRGSVSSEAVVPNAALANNTQPVSTRPPSYSDRSGVSHRGKAISGFCLSLGGLLIGPVAIVGVIMSGVALSNMSTSNNEQGKGFAIAGVIVGFIALLAWLVILLA